MSRPVGRPKTKIDKDMFEKLCAMHCTLVEVAEFFDCSEDTIERWCKEKYGEDFADILKKKSAKGNISLRRSQFQSAESGNVTMQIWLGKQWLGQTDKQEVAVSVEDDETVKEMEKYFADKKEKEDWQK